ncbi:MAG TPA: hypothetical protein VNR51_00620 [Hyphomicrobium sp.]|nr:hypothetical protein [Hyphomicrobium sp.]
MTATTDRNIAALPFDLSGEISYFFFAFFAAGFFAAAFLAGFFAFAAAAMFVVLPL